MNKMRKATFQSLLIVLAVSFLLTTFILFFLFLKNFDTSEEAGLLRVPLKALFLPTTADIKIGKSRKITDEPIPILVFSCNRPTALAHLLSRLLLVRGPERREKFPIVVTQDCDDYFVRMVALKFGLEIKYIRQKKTEIHIPADETNFETYYRIAQHYKSANDYIFMERNFSSVIILEDDLTISDDFFEYFSATRYLLDVDPSLWCVSAWNDNGKPDLIDLKGSEKLHRTDFMPGLGWMMTSRLWLELRDIWPTRFWDDWMRFPERRKGRQCIRPEISRTGMSFLGQKGASRGLFYDQHLSKVFINRKFVDFKHLDLNYLLNATYNENYHAEVNSAVLATSQKVQEEIAKKEKFSGKKFRIAYSNASDLYNYLAIFGLMTDLRAGVARTAYDGIVSCFVEGIRIFLIPNKEIWTGYNVAWS